MISFFVRGIAIGLLFGLPAGAVGAMTAQRTWNYGMGAGLLTGLGSSVADCFYACVGAFGLTLISDFLLRYQDVIHTIGGVLVIGMGIRLLADGAHANPNRTEARGKAGLFLSSFAVGITNPAAILTFLFAFSWFGITGETGLLDGMGLVLGVFAGTYLWWGALSGTVAWLKRKAKALRMSRVNKVFGSILLIFGAVVLMRNFLPG